MTNYKKPNKVSTLKFASSFLEIGLFLILAPICGYAVRSLGVFTDEPVWLLSWFFPAVTADLIIAGVQAILIVCIPIIVFRWLWDSDLIKSPFSFFTDKRNLLFFTIGLILLTSIFGLEAYNVIAKTQFLLDQLVDCPSPPGFCNQAAIDQERRLLERNLERAPVQALLLVAANFLIAAFTAFLYRNKEK